MRRKICQKRLGRKRGGVVLVIALVLLMLFSVILMGMLRGLMGSVRQVDRAHRQHQSVWLANAGMERAAFRMRRDGEYTGERWEITADQLALSTHQTGGGALQAEPVTAVVEITIQNVAGDEDRKRVLVTADYPAAERLRIRTHKSVLVDLTP